MTYCKKKSHFTEDDIMTFKTKMLPPDDGGIAEAAALIKRGAVVGMPTETVYGLAANALDPEAVKKIFIAKGRPQDNPLIIHISDIAQMEMYAHDIPKAAYKLAETFWSGPLTMVLPKRDIIPLETSGGLDTIGIRFPSNKTAQKFISACGVPLATPSANLSGSPSPTCAEHVLKDMNGRVPAIIDAGESAVGVESTVVSFEGERVRLLRPGFVSFEELRDTVGDVIADKGILEKVAEGEKVRSPGMKYKHYAPKADVSIIICDDGRFREFYDEKSADGVYFMNFGGEGTQNNCLPYGKTSEEQAHLLFGRLRECDEIGAKTVYARCPEKTGVGLAVYNRLLRAAGFKVIKL